MEGGSSTRGETFKHYEPSLLQHSKRYHVFLSFLGTDVGNILIYYLYNSLASAGFQVFLEIESLEKGKNTEFSLGDAITNSSVHIPILSPNYATSPWCLHELSLMWTCKSTCTGTTIIPLFYNVEPSDVRYPHNEGPYAKAFQEHREKVRLSEKKMDAWKEALHQVSLLSGWSLAKTAGCNKGRLVKLVVRDLLTTLNINSLYVAKDTVGYSDVVKEVITLLETNDLVGISGIISVRSKTIAVGIYSNIKSKFEASCIVYRVRDCAKESVKGLLKLQKQILRELVAVDESTLKKLNSVPRAKIEIKNRLRSIKALVVLHDVKDKEQLDVLVGDAFNGCWFGAGSRIIVTTPDSHVLKRQTPVIQRSMRRFYWDESLVELFSWKKL